jgi:Holliday junction resolvase RusA-like endonuclease
MLLDLTFITSAQIIVPVKKILSENILYRPTMVYGKGTGKRKMFFRIDNEVREYKEHVKNVCETSDFHEHLTEIRDKYQNLAIVSSYTFMIPFDKFFVSRSDDFSRLDVTNMVKAVEDTILGEVIDDKYVLENTVKKIPVMSTNYTIEATFEFYSYAVIVDERERVDPSDFALISQLEDLL